jgi:glycyl-tRNA synthetase alpha subunit
MGRNESTLMIMLGCSFIGIIMAMMEYWMYTRGLLITATLDVNVTIGTVMIATVIVWEMMGVLLSATRH